MRREDLLRQVGALAGRLPPVLPSTDIAEQLTGLCRTARLAFGAAAVSVAALRDDELHYVAAAGAGAEAIVGTSLPVSRGISGYVALTGQSLAIDQAGADQRFARDVAERTGYVPTTMMVVPVLGPNAAAVGVLAVLDRAAGDRAHADGSGVDALALAGSFADQAGLLLPVLDETGRAARLLRDALVAALASGDASLATALRRAVATAPDEDVDLTRIVATLAELRGADAETRRRVADVLGQIVALAAPRRRR